MNRWTALGLLLALVVALALRLPQLEQRPLHNDEAVNAMKFLTLWEQGVYRYDFNEHHGPALPYATLVAGWLSAAVGQSPLNDTLLRLVPVAFGLGLIILLWLLADGLGRVATVVAGALTALSPAMVYYSRYYIHEILLVFFTLMLFVGGWRFWKTHHWGWAVMTGAALGLMHATKETFVIELAALGAAVVATLVWTRWRDRQSLQRKDWLRPVPVGIVVGVWAVVAWLLFSSFLTNLAGPLDSIRTYAPWGQRAGGASPHIHPWYFYLQRLFWFHAAHGPIFSEALILGLALVGMVAGLTRRGLGETNPTLVRLLGFYTLLLTAAYSVISYKTPWCFLAFLHGMILLAGVGAVVLVNLARPIWLKALVGLLLLLGGVDLARQAWRDSFPYATNRRNPYVYAHTSVDVLNLVELVESLARVHPQGHGMMLKVISPADDYWPLPWYLRAFKQTGWWSELPADPFAPVTIVATRLHATLEEKSAKKQVMVGLFGLRPNVFLELYVEADLWQRYLASRTKRAPEP